MTGTVRTGFGLAEAVLGAGLLIAPPVIAGVAGGSAPAAWLVHLVGGAAFSATLGLLALTRTGPGSIAEVAGKALGGWAEKGILLVYLGGFIVGQAAVALAAGGFLTAGFGGGVSAGSPPAGWSAVSWSAVGLLGLAAVAATLGIRVSDPVRRWRLVCTGVVAVVMCRYPEVLAAAGLLPSGDGSERFALAVFLLFFAGVGWEASARLVPPLAGKGRAVGAVALGATVVAVAYLVLATMLRAGPTSSGLVGPLSRSAAVVAAVLLGGYCVTNIQAAGRFLATLGGPAGAVGNAVVGAACVVALLGAVTVGWGVPDVLLVPCLAAWTGYALAMVAALRQGSMSLRVIASGLLGGLLALLVSVGFAIY